MFLNCHTYFSLKYGCLSPADLVQIGVEYGQDCLVLTDINNTSCTYAFIRQCHKQGIKPIVGIEFRKEDEYLYTGIARNAEGFRNLCELLTKSSLEGIPLPKTAPEMEDVYIIYRQLRKPIESLRDYEFIGVRPQETNRLFRSPILQHRHKLVVFNPIVFRDDTGFTVHRILRCIDRNIMISQLESKQSASTLDRPMPPSQIQSAFDQYREIIENTQRILDTCQIEMPSSYLNNRRTFTGNHSDDFKLLRKLALKGCVQRYGNDNKIAVERTMRELKTINELGFCSYFLITWDIIRYAKSAGYYHVGRGSGANSIVAFNLYITDVDPIELDLYFERFINPHRSSPPDFDIDFSWDERDDVTDYIFKRYGKEHTALLATYNTFKGKSIIRELGKVFGLQKSDIDQIVDYPLDRSSHHPFADKLFYYGKFIEGFPNYLSIHAGGILISERPLNYHTALQMMPKGFPITHFDMYGAEDLEFHKYDILSQRGLGHIKDAVKIIQENQGVAVNVRDVATIKEDPAVKAKLKSSQCIGCFYIESPAMRGLLSKLRCDNYVHLVAASSIIRPGVAMSGMMREYIQRFHKPYSFDYIHPIFEKHLGETFGVMVYQEDVMKIVHHFAGLDLNESDVLRRIMTGKRKNSDTFDRLREKYFVNCQERGYSRELTDEVWRQIASFSGYSFCKAHSASFAVESFQSLFLKTYYPLEFMVAVINNFGGFYSTELYVHEARMQGAIIEAPCVNHSTYLTTIYDKSIYLGLVHIDSLERAVAARIVKERHRHGPYRSLGDFIHRVEVGKESLVILIRIGAFRFTGQSKYELMWEKIALHNPQIKDNGTPSMFPAKEDIEFTLPHMQETLHEQAFDEIELLGFPLCSPFDLLVTKFRGDIKAREMSSYLGQKVRMVGYYVTRKHVTTKHKRHMNFGTWIDDEGHFFDSVHFPDALKRSPFLGKACYLMVGKVVEDFGFPSLEVSRMGKLPIVEDTVRSDAKVSKPASKENPMYNYHQNKVIKKAIEGGES